MKFLLKYTICLLFFVLTETPSADSCLVLDKINKKNKFIQPTAILYDDQAKNWLVAEKKGILYSYNSQTQSKKKLYQWSDQIASHSEGGLLGLAINPFDKRLFVSLTIKGEKRTMVSTIRSYQFKKQQLRNQREIIQIKQPYSNHNGGVIHFGKDSNLYYALGDGGAGGDPLNHSQNTQTLLGSILRINVNKQKPYSIPKDNPFANNQEEGRPEIYAWGLRNPWQMTFDRKTNELWAVDVGQDEIEEINIIEKGKNYGWRCFEGNRRYGTSEYCIDNFLNFTMPIYQYDHSQGQSITGGYVYRGAKYPKWQGYYIFADFVTGKLWALETLGEINSRQTKQVIALKKDSENYYPVSFAEDAQGELLMVDIQGWIYRLQFRKEPNQCQ